MAVDNNREFVKSNTPRLFYLEPNDILGKVDGRPITPDYTDFCISFKLTAEVIDRTRYDGFTQTDGNGKTLTIGWVGRGSAEGETYVDLMGSRKLGRDNKRYLTTYYTDVSYQDFSKETVVEGLGVESIDIQFKDQWVPTITIKFVDIRGASLFGREEAIHKNDEITSENIFGCFFTVPYPKFRLQIKGYYGREVTYQLYCSNFSVNFNANTGNFEATVTFLGYMYGILADLPMAYLMIAPYCSYAKADGYWKKHRLEDLDWRLYETSIGVYGFPEKLIDLREEIKSAIRGDREHFKSILSNIDKKSVDNNTEKIDASKNLVVSYIKIINPLKEKYGPFKRNGDTYISNELNVKPLDDDIKSITSKPITDYNKSLEKYSGLTNTMYPGLSGGEIEVSTTQSNGKEKYVISIPIPQAVEDTKITISDSEDEIRAIEDEANENASKITIKDLIKIYPYIGNVIKVALCHMETFMYMMKTCVEEVNNDRGRTFEAKRVNIKDTDCVLIGDSHRIPPFPGIRVDNVTDGVDEGTNVFETAQQSILKNIGWIGDVMPDAPEARLVNSIFEAMKNKGYNKEESTTASESEEEETNRDRDIKVAIYTHLKNIYDRWLINNEFDEYKAGTYFKNFVFIDSFFRNITYELHVNPTSLGKQLDAVANDDGRFLKFISSIATNEHCSMFGLPNTFLFKDGHGNDQEIVEGLVSAFKPIPYSKMGKMETSNQIVILYTYKPSEIVNEDNGYRGDYFDVYSDGNLETINLPTQLKDEYGGYNIPAFGVAFGRQDNAIFKSFKLSMENPVATEQAINALSRLSEKAGASKAKIQYYGQDIYQVYSGYSYFCEFDMMGDVQIMPMMYFQLLNIPLFKGAYMIINVSHTMKQGDMTTHVKGMRLSRNALPLTKAWFTPELKIRFDESGNIENTDELIEQFASDESNYEYYDYGGMSGYTWQEMMKQPDSEKHKWLCGYENMKVLRENVPYEKKNGRFVCSDEGWENSYITDYTFTDGPLSGMKVRINRRLVEGMDPWVKRFEQKMKELYENTEFSSYIKKSGIYFYSYRPVNNEDGNNLSNHSLGVAFDIFGVTSNIPPDLIVKQTDTPDIAQGKVKKAITTPIGNGYWRERTKNYNYLEEPLGITNIYDADYANAITRLVPTQANEKNPKFIRRFDHEFVKAMSEIGFGWGGRYGDTMHFSFFGGN